MRYPSHLLVATVALAFNSGVASDNDIQVESFAKVTEIVTAHRAMCEDNEFLTRLTELLILEINKTKNCNRALVVTQVADVLDASYSDTTSDETFRSTFSTAIKTLPAQFDRSMQSTESYTAVSLGQSSPSSAGETSLKAVEGFRTITSD